MENNEIKKSIDEVKNKAKETLDNFDAKEKIDEAKKIANETAEKLKNVDIDEVKKKWSWKGFFFNAYYYAGKGELKKGIVLAIIAGFAMLGNIFTLLGLGVAVYGGLKAREELNLENKFNWKNVIIASVANFIALFLALIIKGMFIGGGDIALVKNGYMNFNKTTTIGEALDNWDNCKNTKWESFTTKNGIKVVQFTCEDRNVKEFFDAIKSYYLLDDRTKKEDLKPFNIDKVLETIQFTINKDGKTFQASYGGIEYIWDDGKSFKDTKNPITILKQAYNNKDSFDMELLKNKAILGKVAWSLGPIMGVARSRAK
jgi:hypothetical protein